MTRQSQRHRLACGLSLAWLMALAASASSAQAQAAEEPASGTEEPNHALTLVARAVVGALVEEEESRFGGGGSLSLAVPVVHWLEVEGSLAVLKAPEVPTLGVAELVAKLLFEVEGDLEPHVSLGPVLSLDFGGRNALLGGFVVGPGFSVFPKEQLGFNAELLYRFLMADGELEHVLSCGLGIAYRL